MNAVISLTTIPDRIAQIEPTVKSLLAQDLPVYVWAVEKIARSETRLKRIPDWLADSGAHVEIVEDRGPITKLLPALERADIVLTADDDHIYSGGWASGLLEWAKRRPGAALCYRGRILGNDSRYAKSKLVIRPPKPRRVDLITGVHGALYRVKFFDASIFTEWQQWPRNDDIVISAHLWRRGVPMLVIPRACTITATVANSLAPLCKLNTGRRRLNDTGVVKMYKGHKWHTGGTK